MTQILKRLRSDHQRVRVLMELFENELKADSTGGNTDYELVHEIVTYCSEYLNRFHHPLEDRLFERMLRRDPSLEKPLDRILAEHSSLIRDTGLLLYMLDQLLLGEMLSRQKLADGAGQFVSRNREHMRREEETIFSHAAELLSEEDWNDLAMQSAGNEDPLASRQALHHFRLLSRRLATG